MYRFYIDKSQINDRQIVITGSDVNHIKNVLRLEKGNFVIACDNEGMDYISRICRLDMSEVILEVEKKQKTETELDRRIVLFQGLPKREKMEFIIQKAVELGVSEIVPVAMKRCVVKLTGQKKTDAKLARWRAVAEAAAKQSGRGFIPKVSEPVSIHEAFERAQNLEYNLIPYELHEGMEESRRIMSDACSKQSVGIFIGPEGGFEKDEVDEAVSCGIKRISLGKRILRTETAGMAVLAIMMFQVQGD